MVEQEFKIRVCVSGSSGVAFYMPKEIVKALDLKNNINTYIPALLDEDGDITIYSSEVVTEDK